MKNFRSRLFIRLSIFVSISCLAPAVWADVYFPQIAAGGGYTTVVTLMHTDARSSAAANGVLKFYNADGSARTVTTAELGQGSQFNLTLPSQGTRVVTVTSAGDVSVGTAIYQISGVSVGGVATFTFQGASVGVLNATPIDLAYVPLTTRSGFDNGVAIQNVAPVPINVQFRLLKPDGTIDQVSSPAAVNPLPAFGQYSRLVGPEMGFTGPVQANSTLEIAGSSVVAILPLVIGNGYISSSSLVTFNGETPLFFAQIVDGGGYTTAIRLFNPYSLAATGSLKFFSQNGSPRSLPVTGLGTVSQIPISLAAGRAVVYETSGTSAGVSVGMARLDTSAPIGGLATLFFGQTHVGVQSTAAMRSGRIAVSTVGGDTGVALGTAGVSPVGLRLTLQNRDGGGAQVAQPAEVSPLPVNGQFAKYVTQMGFSSSANLTESSLLVEPTATGTFIPLALLDRGGFSSTATSRQRLYDPASLAATYTGSWSMPVFGSSFGGSLTIGLSVNASSGATISLNITGNPGTFVTAPPPGSATGTFTPDGELNVNGPMNVRLKADGAFTIFAVAQPGKVITPSGPISWYAFTGEVTGTRMAGTITIGQTDGTTVSGTFNLNK